MTDLATRLRTADPRQLSRIVRERRAELSPAAVRQLLDNSYVDGRLIDELLDHPELRKHYDVRRRIAAHPRTRQARAVGLVAGLYWRDLLRLGSDSRVKPAVRRAADMRLAERFGRLSEGEKVVVAREAGPGLIPRLFDQRHPQVLAALLGNPRLTEPMLAPLVASHVTAPAVLRRIAEDPRWGVRYSTRLALCRNPATPADLAVSLLPALTKRDRREVARDIRVAADVRRRASLLAEC